MLSVSKFQPTSSSQDPASEIAGLILKLASSRQISCYCTDMIRHINAHDIKCKYWDK